jgi:hypothetical protein
LEGEDAADEEGEYADHEEASVTDFEELVTDLEALVPGGRESADGVPEEDDEFADVMEHKLG